VGFCRLRREGARDPQALGVQILALAEANHQNSPRPLREQRRGLAKGGLDISGPGRSGKLGRQLLAVAERDRNEVCVDLCRSPRNDFHSHGGRVY
jgi:hypothetical protein